MQPMGFVLLCIGVLLVIGARRIVLANTKLEESDQKEMELLATGGIIAVRIAGLIVALVGILFMMM